METCGTTHMTTNEFADALASAPPGAHICYARGDLAYSSNGASHSESHSELQALRLIVWEAYTRKRAHLTQRRRPDVPFFHGKRASFEYIATKASEKPAEATKTSRANRKFVSALALSGGVK